MATLDTNVLVRWLVVDDEVQAEAVASLLASCAERNERLYVPLTVMLELEWVLRSRYRFEKASVLAAMDGLMSASELAFQEEAALEQSLWQYRRVGAPDYADCLHVALADQARQGPLLTFDQRATRLEGAQLMPVQG
ncbi:type II toxin-antitoxin system VapC family toxin [Hydrogenophaga aromaticivorans]|uniref:type II toxin-antitoxin system VapC family toxin n=1 Tax=Hydrogenophaga aromaticivorans TaxID=2610898 RepID=UPI001B37DEF2|nr:type II toxin-antitoxin system VapC family toxin [Hydrogenophaga aromaticivorans]MBQ0921357.1 type II toxin-antitoxin system VapC family toxin [Hydrogenophaga aromaticivorans]